tara:strand:+ start:2152 stop:2970 length:819 start_codon:yes stop_codon:yes gene_type:complete
MARILSSIGELPTGSVVVVFDTEAVGDVNNPQTCYLWNLSAQIMGKEDAVFDSFITPPVEVLPKVPNEKLFKVTHEFLAGANAVLCSSAIEHFWKWVLTYVEGEGIIVMVAHGNFRFDKVLFETEHQRYCKKVPDNTYFFDTLHWFRTIMPKQKSYALNNVHKKLFGRDIENQHLSIFDVYGLNRCIEELKRSHLFSGIMYPAFTTPLIRIPGVGLHTQRLLLDRNINAVEDLFSILVQQLSGDYDGFIAHLTNVGLPIQTAQAIVTYLRTF